MPDEQFEFLFSPLQLGPVTVPNRISFSAHSSGMAVDSLPSERQARYYAERAKGGAGWLVVGATVAHESSAVSPHMNVMCEEAVPGYRRLTDAVHEHGAKVSTQLDHWGAVLGYPRIGRAAMLAPSAVVGVGQREMPKEIEAEDIDLLLEGWAKGVRLSDEAGFDGVELIASMGYGLIQHFLSPRTNKRTDEYGGSLENRMRFPLRVLETVHSALGPNQFFGLKLSGDELVDGGLQQDELTEIAAQLAESGFLHYLHICVGSENDASVWVPEATYPAGFATYLAASVRERVDIPIVTVKRINDPMQAEQLIREGQADAVAMARALIADPELPNKARTGQLREIRQCTGSNQECAARDLAKLPLSCLHNPAVGEEGRWGIGTLTISPRKKSVAVIGGGPAGLKAAEIAARKGHDVHLYERSDVLGGQVNYITQVASRKDFESITRYLIHQVTERLGVNVHLGEALTAEAAIALGADATIVATGARALRTGYTVALPGVETLPGVDQDNVLSIFDVFERPEAVGQRVLVIDEFGDAEAIMAVEHLADRGHHVEMVTPQPYPAVTVDEYTIDSQLARLVERNVRWTPWTRCTGFDGSRVTGFNVLTEEPWDATFDSAVLLMGKQADDDLYRGVKGRVADLYRIGDCLAPRRITDAIYEGQLVAWDL